MWCTVTLHGVPIGTVELRGGELTSGRMKPLEAYRAVQSTVRRGSVALLSVGFYGTVAPAPGERDPRTIEALSAAAALRFELRDDRGEQLGADFINLIEPPDEDGVVVIARLRGALLGVPARRTSHHAGGSEENGDQA